MCLEMEVLMGLPIWRFLKLSEYQMNLFEKNYEKELISRQKYLEENYPCKRCIFFKENDASRIVVGRSCHYLIYT